MFWSTSLNLIFIKSVFRRFHLSASLLILEVNFVLDLAFFRDFGLIDEMLKFAVYYEVDGSTSVITVWLGCRF